MVFGESSCWRLAVRKRGLLVCAARPCEACLSGKPPFGPPAVVRLGRPLAVSDSCAFLVMASSLPLSSYIIRTGFFHSLSLLVTGDLGALVVYPHQVSVFFRQVHPIGESALPDKLVVVPAAVVLEIPLVPVGHL